MSQLKNVKIVHISTLGIGWHERNKNMRTVFQSGIKSWCMKHYKQGR